MGRVRGRPRDRRDAVGEARHAPVEELAQLRRLPVDGEQPPQLRSLGARHVDVDDQTTAPGSAPGPGRGARRVAALISTPDTWPRRARLIQRRSTRASARPGSGTFAPAAHPKVCNFSLGTPGLPPLRSPSSWLLVRCALSEGPCANDRTQNSADRAGSWTPGRLPESPGAP